MFYKDLILFLILKRSLNVLKGSAFSGTDVTLSRQEIVLNVHSAPPSAAYSASPNILKTLARF